MDGITRHNTRLSLNTSGLHTPVTPPPAAAPSQAAARAPTPESAQEREQAASAFAALRAALERTRACGAAAFSSGDAAGARSIAHELLQLFSDECRDEPPTLMSLPAELLTLVLCRLGARDLCRLDSTGRDFHGLPAPPSLIELALRQRAAQRGEPVPASRPLGEASWTQMLAWRDWRTTLPRQTVATGMHHTAFIDAGGALLTCGTEEAPDDESGCLLGHGRTVRLLATPTAVPALLGVRVHSVSAGDHHTLALTESGAAFSFGSGAGGRLCIASHSTA